MGSYTPRNFIPLPIDIPVQHRDPDARWRVPLATGLVLDNAPPYRYLLIEDQVVARWEIGYETEERMILLQVLRQGWLTAKDLAEHWGVHRNTLGNWRWRYRFFGLDGLIDGRLPARRERMEAILVAAKEIVRQGGRRLSTAALARALRAQGLGELPPSTLAWLHAVLSRPREQALVLGEAPDEGDDGDPDDDDPGKPPSEGLPAGGHDVAADGGDPQPNARREADAVENESTRGGESQQSAALVPPSPTRTITGGVTRLPQAGLALALPMLQGLLDPLAEQLEQSWGDRPWHYRPLQLVQSTLLYLLADFRNPEQVKAAPAKDFGPLLGLQRGPACATLRRRLPLMAKRTPLVEDLQRALALQYLQLGWVQPGAWLVDGHFSPYFGREAWPKAWWPQRRMAVPGYFQEWVHDHRGRPLWLHVAQGFDVFADQLPVVADGLLELLSAAGLADEPVLMVFDRGGYSSQVFTALNARGVGWVTWLKGKAALPPEAFTATGELAAGPGQASRTIYYAQTTHAVQGCSKRVPAVFWHEGDPAHQIALLSNVDARYPGRFGPLDLIRMLTGRWAQENAFKAMIHTVDLDWTNGYVHEPCAGTLVPNPEIRRLRKALGERTVQLRAAMDRANVPRGRRAAARYRRKVGTLRALVTRLQNQIARTPAAVPYGQLGRSPTSQLHAGRGLLLPVLRAVAYHVRLQLRDHVAAVFPDHREWDKVLRVLLRSPGHYVHTADADWVILDRPQLPRYATALSAIIDRLNDLRPHAPLSLSRPLRFQLLGS